MCPEEDYSLKLLLAINFDDKILVGIEEIM